MTKKEEIIQLADNLIRKNGFNAFSYHEISGLVGIKTASIHYHFPTKADLGVAVIDQHLKNLQELILQYEGKEPSERLERFFTIYANILNDHKVCLVGSLATDFNTLNEKIQSKLKSFSELMLQWVIQFLDEGRNKGQFYFRGDARSKALMIITNMLAIVQLTRLTSNDDFEVVKSSIKNEILNKEI